MSALSDLLNSNPHGWKARRAAIEAEKRGVNLKQGTLSGYFSGRHGVPSDELLNNLSTVLDIPLHKLREAVGKPGSAEPYTPPRESWRLTSRQRNALDELIRSMVAESDSEPGAVSRPVRDEDPLWMEYEDTKRPSGARSEEE